MKKSTRFLLITTLNILGVLSIASGIMYSSLQKKASKKTILVVVEQKQIQKEIDANINLKNLTIEINTPLSIKIVDYLDSAVSDEVLANLKLDTSSVDVTKVGTYSYTVTYKKKVYKALITVKETPKSTESLQSITLKTLNIKVGTIPPTDISNYIIEPLTDEVKSTMIIDLSNVNVNKPGSYQYTIKYNNSIYTGTITVTNDQPTLAPSKEETLPTEPKEDNNQEQQEEVKENS